MSIPICMACIISCFNPRAHAGRDTKRIDNLYCYLIVSIHAPTRGATFLYTMLNDDFKVSIHAPTRGATSKEKTL